MICLKRSIFLGVTACAALICGCTEVDDSLGKNFIPADQQMSVDLDVLGVEAGDPDYVKTFLVQQDSLQTSNMGVVLIGSRLDSYLGYAKAGAVVQPFCGYSSSTEKYYGYNPEVDSVYLSINISDMSGKTDVEQDFSIYSLTADINRDSVYYADVNIDEITDNLSTKLFTFKYSGSATGARNIKLTPTAAGNTYIAGLVEADHSLEPDEFLETFKGLYITPDNDRADAALYGITLSNSYIDIYFHNYDEKNPTVRKDTSYMPYMLADGYSGYEPASITSIKRDYTAGSLSAYINVDGAEADVAMVECFGGVFTQLKLQPGLADRLRGLCPAGKALAVNKALIYFDAKEKTDYVTLDNMTKRLGMYYRYATFSPIDDYNFYYETQGGSIPYGGTFNRSTGLYTMDITSTVQRIVSKDTYKDTILLAPDYSYLYALRLSPLIGSADTDYRIRLKITYSLIVP